MSNEGEWASAEHESSRSESAGEVDRAELLENRPHESRRGRGYDRGMEVRGSNRVRGDRGEPRRSMAETSGTSFGEYGAHSVREAGYAGVFVGARQDAEVELIKRAAHVLGANEVARWMNTDVPSLNGQTPLSLMTTEEGRKQVETILGRIEHGIF
jgi:hypothetical protein